MNRTFLPVGDNPAVSADDGPPDLAHAVALSWNRIRYFHVGWRHAYALPARNDNPSTPAPRASPASLRAG